MKKKQMVMLVISLLIISILCFITINNIGIGPKSMFFRTISDYPNTVWVCEEPSAIVKVTYEQFGEVWGSESILEAEIDGVKKRFRIYTIANSFDLFQLDENGQQITNVVNDTSGNIIRTHVKYRKNIFGQITSFRLKVLNDNQSIKGYKTLKFTKEN